MRQLAGTMRRVGGFELGEAKEATVFRGSIRMLQYFTQKELASLIDNI